MGSTSLFWIGMFAYLGLITGKIRHVNHVSINYLIKPQIKILILYHFNKNYIYIDPQDLNYSRCQKMETWTILISRKNIQTLKCMEKILRLANTNVKS